jgi:hypothetical protein
MPVCLQVASAGSVESIILSAGGAESMMLSAFAESMDTLSAGAESAESIILSAPPTESMILSVLFGRVIMLTAAATKKTTIGNTEGCQLTTLVNSASTAAPIGLTPNGAEFCHTSNRLLVGRQCPVPYRGCILIPLRLVVGRWSLVIGHWLVGWSTIRVLWEVSLQKGKKT